MRPNPNSNTQVAEVMKIYGISEAEARIRLEAIQIGYDSGVKAGRAEAQRFFRLALGVEVPEPHESALWNNPVPLRTEE